MQGGARRAARHPSPRNRRKRRPAVTPWPARHQIKAKYGFCARRAQR
ncbi:hypothetical protein BURPS1106B_0534 [Burkholderia pseudomallei 1106b]|nr:hypothetical protein BURPS1106B_0534 [Burkholderia pseudomallei 1106b]